MKNEKKMPKQLDDKALQTAQGGAPEACYAGGLKYSHGFRLENGQVCNDGSWI